MTYKAMIKRMPQTIKRLFMVWGICVFAQTALQAQEDSLKASRYLMRATLYGVGYSNVYDTYLSPRNIRGWTSG